MPYSVVLFLALAEYIFKFQPRWHLQKSNAIAAMTAFSRCASKMTEPSVYPWLNIHQLGLTKGTHKLESVHNSYTIPLSPSKAWFSQPPEYSSRTGCERTVHRHLGTSSHGRDTRCNCLVVWGEEEKDEERNQFLDWLKKRSSTSENTPTSSISTTRAAPQCFRTH